MNFFFGILVEIKGYKRQPSKKQIPIPCHKANKGKNSAAHEVIRLKLKDIR
jgi:hypothetical protein